MPTIFKIFNFRFMFYSSDHEPVHIHVERGDCGTVARILQK
ncbi:MAG: DUF4160 domain-containing protein [Bacteroidales bacterium]|nr:DUF4160 domain-containing protein [Bacteroidales bacterium]